ncbi:hypothetical protein Tco_0566201 [Tanacetum coccineum]
MNEKGIDSSKEVIKEESKEKDKKESKEEVQKESKEEESKRKMKNLVLEKDDVRKEDSFINTSEDDSEESELMELMITFNIAQMRKRQWNMKILLTENILSKNGKQSVLELNHMMIKVLWGDLMVMFNPDDENEFWNSQQDWNIVSWKLHGSSGVHTLVTEAGLVIHMIIEKKYPLGKKYMVQML